MEKTVLDTMRELLEKHSASYLLRVLSEAMLEIETSTPKLNNWNVREMRWEHVCSGQSEPLTFCQCKQSHAPKRDSGILKIVERYRHDNGLSY